MPKANSTDKRFIALQIKTSESPSLTQRRADNIKIFTLDLMIVYAFSNRNHYPLHFSAKKTQLSIAEETCFLLLLTRDEKNGAR